MDLRICPLPHRICAHNPKVNHLEEHTWELYQICFSAHIFYFEFTYVMQEQKQIEWVSLTETLKALSSYHWRQELSGSKLRKDACCFLLRDVSKTIFDRGADIRPQNSQHRVGKQLISQMLIQCHKEGRKTIKLHQSCKHYVDHELIRSNKKDKKKYAFSSPHAKFDWKEHSTAKLLLFLLFFYLHNGRKIWYFYLTIRVNHSSSQPICWDKKFISGIEIVWDAYFLIRSISSCLNASNSTIWKRGKLNHKVSPLRCTPEGSDLGIERIIVQVRPPSQHRQAPCGWFEICHLFPPKVLWPPTF